jgi:hypothetical protein
LSLLDRCQAGVFELWVPAAPRLCGCKVEDRPQGVDVRGSARVLAGVGHLAAPEVADCAIAASEDIEAADIAIVGADAQRDRGDSAVVEAIKEPFHYWITLAGSRLKVLSIQNLQLPATVLD